MANFTAKDVNELRKSTGAGLMDCKKALTEADGDTDKAIELLRERGLAIQAKKQGRTSAEGVVIAVTNDDHTVGAVAEVNCETDFVSANEDFVSFATKVAKTVLEKNPADLAALDAATIPGESKTVKEEFDEVFLKFRENLKIRRFKRIEGNVVSYVHAGGKIGTLVNLKSSNGVSDALLQVGKDVALQVTAMNPSYLNESEVPQSVIDEETKVALEQVNNDPKLASKPDKVKQNIAKGKLKKFYSENCLLDQEFVKDSNETVGSYVKKSAKEAGADFEVTEFVRFERGEGIDK